MIERHIGSGIDFKRADTAITASRHIYADNEIPGGIKKFFRANKAGPPFGGITIRRKGMKDPDDIISFLVKCSMGGIGKMVARQANA